jgi:hypothetical protein
MGATIHYDYAEDIRNFDFRQVAALIRKGDISALDQESRELLAGYLDGTRKRRKGRPRNDEFNLSQYLHNEYTCLRNFGKTSSEMSQYVQKHATADNLEQLNKECRKLGMKREEAIDVLAKKEGLNFKNVERLVDAWAKYERIRDDGFSLGSP